MKVNQDLEFHNLFGMDRLDLLDLLQVIVFTHRSSLMYLLLHTQLCLPVVLLCRSGLAGHGALAVRQ